MNCFLKCMGSIKSVVGIFGILLIVALVLTPIVKILAVAVIYKITSLLIEPVASKKLSQSVSDIGTSLIAMGAILFFASRCLLFSSHLLSVWEEKCERSDHLDKGHFYRYFVDYFLLKY